MSATPAPTFLLGAVLGADLLTLKNSSAFRMTPGTQFVVTGKAMLREALALLVKHDDFFLGRYRGHHRRATEQSGRLWCHRSCPRARLAGLAPRTPCSAHKIKKRSTRSRITEEERRVFCTRTARRRTTPSTSNPVSHGTQGVDKKMKLQLKKVLSTLGLSIAMMHRPWSTLLIRSRSVFWSSKRKNRGSRTNGNSLISRQRQRLHRGQDWCSEW